MEIAYSNYELEKIRLCTHIQNMFTTYPHLYSFTINFFIQHSIRKGKEVGIQVIPEISNFILCKNGSKKYYFSFIQNKINWLEGFFPFLKKFGMQEDITCNSEKELVSYKILTTHLLNSSYFKSDNLMFWYDNHFHEGNSFIFERGDLAMNLPKFLGKDIVIKQKAEQLFNTLPIKNGKQVKRKI